MTRLQSAMRVLHATALTIGACVLPASVAAQIPQAADLAARARGAMHAAELTIQTVRPETDADGVVRASVVFGGQAATLELEPLSLRSADFQLFVQGEDGALRQIEAPTPTTYRGHVAGRPLSTVTASVVDGRVFASVRLDAYTSWHVQPLSTVLADAAPDQHAVFNAADVVPPDYDCGVDQESLPDDHADHDHATPAPSIPAPAVPGSSDPDFGGSGGSTRGGLQATEIAFDGDFEYFQLNGNSVTNCVNDIELVLNQADTVYQPLGIAYILRAIIIRTAEPDPYSASGTLTASQMRTEFQAEWVANNAGIPRDIAHLMSNRASSDGFVGWASGSVICSQANGYGYSLASWNAGNIVVRGALLAHELGHNWSCCHCNQATCTGGGTDADCGIMCTNPAGCTAGPTTWGARSTAAILNHLSTRACLSALLNTVYVDNDYVGAEVGTLAQPFNTVREGSWAVSRGGGTLSIDTGNYNQRIILRRPMTLIAPNGVVNIGQ